MTLVSSAVFCAGPFSKVTGPDAVNLTSSSCDSPLRLVISNAIVVLSPIARNRGMAICVTTGAAIVTSRSPCPN